MEKHDWLDTARGLEERVVILETTIHELLQAVAAHEVLLQDLRPVRRNCPRCGRAADNHAKACPMCGTSLPVPTGRGR